MRIRRPPFARSRTRSLRLVFAFVLCAIAPLALAAQEDDTATFAALGRPIRELTQALAKKPVLSISPAGTTAIVLKLDLEGDIDAAFKPASKRHPQGYRAEVAAYRLSRALGLTNVPPAVVRSFALNELEALAVGAGKARFWELASELTIRTGRVEGAAIYWIPDMREIGLDTAEGMQHWRRWLSQAGDPPSRERSKVVAAQVSTMIAFDYLIGNWDRFSGANAQGDKSERVVYVRDHNTAFYDPLPRTQLDRVASRLKQVQRFSRAFVTQLRALDRAKVTRVLHDETDPLGFVALSESQVAGVMDRRLSVLSYVAALIDEFGESNVLTFP